MQKQVRILTFGVYICPFPICDMRLVPYQRKTWTSLSNSAVVGNRITQTKTPRFNTLYPDYTVTFSTFYLFVSKITVAKVRFYSLFSRFILSNLRNGRNRYRKQERNVSNKNCAGLCNKFPSVAFDFWNKV